MPYFEPKTLVSQRGFSVLFLMALTLMVFGALIVSEFLADLLLTQIYGSELVNLNSIDTLKNIKEHPEARTPLLIKQGLQALLGFVLIPWIYIKFILKKPIKVLSPNQKIASIGWVLTIVATLVFMVINARIVEWNMQWDLEQWFGPAGTFLLEAEDLLKEVTEFITQFDSTGQFLIGMLVIAVLPAIGEELLFRGCIQNQLFNITRNTHIAIWVTAFFFSAIHVQFLGFVPRMLLGALFGYLYFWSGNLLVPMLAHFFNNGLQIFLLYAYQRQGFTYNIDQMEDSVPLWLVAVCSVTLIGVLYYFKTKVDESGQLPNSGKWQSVFHSDQNDRIEKVRLVLAEKGLHPVIIDSKHVSLEGPVRKEVHVAPIYMAQAQKIIEQNITFE
ncbi:MAG: CPBP family intramembrane glutamic endopeptidase [Cyclobacteriaceae bacterium]